MIDSNTDVLILLVGYALSTVGVGIVIGKLITEPKLTPPRLPVTGRVPVPVLIGWFERLLTVTFVLMGDPGAIGLIIVCKTILRFGESRRDREYAEFVLCGTLISLSAALLLSLAIKTALERY